ncbi:uncharacterized protein LOC103707867 isoform X1 [Phoenix dactylifera]|uniref:Uncharacterized protein LOC103707867 isoform X1 n=1 Tax=Phoenix dactylifera TaxID=42345 RepID=A0A8B8J529_PHODC|nr:uncharacterized protein LOC103707867 isoform X1 [Phoenix dactylifera]
MEAEGESCASQSRRHGTASPPSDPARMAGGASRYLADLPSRGLFSNTIPSSNLGGIRVYVCDHDTTPPDEQLIKTNTTNILIRALQINKQKSDSKDAATKATSESKKGKRFILPCFPTVGLARKLVSLVQAGCKDWNIWISAERTSEGRTPSKRAKTNIAPGSTHQEGTSSGFSWRMLHTMTVERLRALLKERGLSPRGKKDELITRLQNEA